MATWNSQGRLLRQVRLSNLGVTLVILLVLVSIFLFFGVSSSTAQTPTSSQPVEIDLFVQGFNMREPKALFQQGLKAGTQANITIRNQPEGQVAIKSIKQLPITIPVPQPDGSVKALADPKADFKTDMVIVLDGKAQVQDTGLMMGKSKLKIGSPAELEGFNYYFKATVIDVRLTS
jgi:Domain of unknown function (DUF4330)